MRCGGSARCPRPGAQRQGQGSLLQCLRLRLVGFSIHPGAASREGQRNLFGPVGGQELGGAAAVRATGSSGATSLPISTCIAFTLFVFFEVDALLSLLRRSSLDLGKDIFGKLLYRRPCSNDFILRQQ